MSKAKRLTLFVIVLCCRTLSVASAQFVDLSQTDQELAESLAPIIYFHPDERYFPMSYTNFIRNSVLKDSSGDEVSTTWEDEEGNDHEAKIDSVADLVYWSTDREDYLDLDNSWRTGDLENAPLYARVVENGDYVDVVYWALYGYSGAQIFRGKFVNSLGLNAKITNFEWNPYQRHEGDLEHLTIRLDGSTGEILGASLAAHGKERWYSFDELEWSEYSGRYRLNTYVALNTHGFWPRKDVFKLETVYQYWTDNSNFWVDEVYWLKTVDTTSTDYLTWFDKLTYTKWKPSAAGKITLVTPTSLITGYKGKWGEKENLDGLRGGIPTGDLPHVEEKSMASLAEYQLSEDKDRYDSAYTGRGAWKHAWFDGLFDGDFDIDLGILSIFPY